MSSNYVHGQMPVLAKETTFKGFLRFSSFATAFLVVVLLMPILVFTAHVDWKLALAITFIVGLIVTKPFKLGGGWVMTLFGLTILFGIVGIFASALTG